MEAGDEATRAIEPGERFHVAGESWRFLCPHAVTSTVRKKEDVHNARISFIVSTDEEHVSLMLNVRGSKITVGCHASNYMLLTLARHRTRDEEDGLAAGDCGWVFQDVLARELATESDNINVDVHRIRRRFTEHFENAADIVERRPRTRQLRLGIRDVEISRV